MRTFYIKGKITDFYKAMLIKANSEIEAIKIYEKVNKEYKKLLIEALKPQKSKVHLFIYNQGKISFTPELSSEIQYHFKNKLIIVGRQKDNLMKLSLRYQNGDLRKMLERALEGLDGGGGGHEHACGSHIHQRDFKEFLERLESYIK